MSTTLYTWRYPQRLLEFDGQVTQAGIQRKWLKELTTSSCHVRQLSHRVHSATHPRTTGFIISGHSTMQHYLRRHHGGLHSPTVQDQRLYTRTYIARPPSCNFITCVYREPSASSGIGTLNAPVIQTQTGQSSGTFGRFLRGMSAKCISS